MGSLGSVNHIGIDICMIEIQTKIISFLPKKGI